MWPFFAFGSSIFTAVNSIFQKETLKKLHAVQLLTVTSFSTVFFSLFLVPYVHFSLDIQQIALISLTTVTYVLAIIFSVKALRHMDISVVAPFFNLGTAFLAVMALIFLREHISVLDGLGITLLVFGGYILELKHRNLLQPIRDVIKSKFIHYLLGGVFFFSLTYLLDKFVLMTIDPVSYLFFRNMGTLLFLLIISFTVYKGAKDIKQGFVLGSWLVPIIGLTAIGENLLVYEALKIAPVSLVIPIYRTWTLFAVIFGGRILHEEHLLKRALASVLMIAGAALILI